MTNKTKEARHFTVTGEAMTQIARDMLLSDRPAQAWRLIAQNLMGGEPGQAEAVAQAVLDGKKKLVGDSTDGIDVEPDSDAANYIKTMRYIYAGRIRVRDRWYRPEAQVVSFNERDAKYAADKLGCYPTKLNPDFEKWAMYRVEFYGHGRGIALDVTDRPAKKKRKRMRKADAEIDVVLFEECSEPPFWWPTHASPADAYADFIDAGRRLHRIDPMGGVAVDAEVTPFIDERAVREQKEEAEVEAELQDEEDRRREIEKIARYREYGEKVRAQANGDFIEIKLPEGYVPTMSPGPVSGLFDDDDDHRPFAGTPSTMFTNGVIKVPRLPFECWCLWRTHLRHMMPEWTCVSPSGLKMQMDDPYHTDWMLGADIHLRHSYDKPLKDATIDMMSQVQMKYGDFEHAVLVGGPDCEGLVGPHDAPGAIMVLHDLRNTPENNTAVANARAIITETGGELAHVATLARENKIPVFRVPNAVKLFPVGTRLALYPKIGKIHHRGRDFHIESD